MKISCISDTHGRPFTIPECDVFIHAGDMTAGGSVDEQIDLLLWLSQQDQARHKIIVPGNHDACYEKYGKHLLHNPSIPVPTVLINEGIEIEGKTFWGSPNTPPFFDWHFMSTEEELAEIYKSMPDDIDILITHGPPRGILDPGWKEAHVGSTSLRDAISGRRIQHHVFGHLHAAGGKTENTPHGRTYHNVAACDDAYNLVRQPIIIEL